MKRKNLTMLIAFAAMAATMVLAPSALGATTVDEGPNASAIPSIAKYFASEAEAKTTITSTVFRPGESYSFSYPSNNGQDTNVISICSWMSPSCPKPAGAKGARSFNSTIFGWTFTWRHYSLGVHIWTWQKYTEWAGNGQCVTNKIANTAWSSYEQPGWTYQGYGYYVVWTINPPCQPLGILWAGRQGHYYNWIWHQDDYPWQLAEAYATGNYRTYDYGCTGACS